MPILFFLGLLKLAIKSSNLIFHVIIRNLNLTIFADVKLELDLFSVQLVLQIGDLLLRIVTN